MTLTREQMKQDIAQAVGIGVDEIADDDNMVDVGVDSMRMMALVLKWEAIDPALNYDQLWEGRAIAEWWNDVESLRAEG